MRKTQAKKRPLLPDPKFNDLLVTRFVNMLMWNGKKSIAFKIFYDAIEIINDKNTFYSSSFNLHCFKNLIRKILPFFQKQNQNEPHLKMFVIAYKKSY